MGGLTSCYAAIARPDFIQRAVCSSPSSCYNYGNGGLATVITEQYAKHGKKPKAVFQYQGQEIYDENLATQQGDETVYANFVADDTAWKNIGMKPYSVMTPVTTPKSASNPYDYSVLEEFPGNVVMSFIVPEGQHMANTWEQVGRQKMRCMYVYD